MRIIVNRTELNSALTWAGKGLSRRPALPVLAGVRLEVAGGRLTISAFDYDVSATASVAGSDTKPGSILVNGATLAGIVKATPKGKTVTVTLERADTPAAEATDDTPARDASSALVVRCQGSTSRITALPEEDYPALPELPPAAGVFAADAFKRSVARVAPLAGTDDTLPVLTTVRVECGAASVDMAATDRYRLGVDTLDWTAQAWQDAAGNGYAFQAPAKLLADFAKSTARGGKVTVHYQPATEPDSDAGVSYAAPLGGFSDETRTVTFRAEYSEFPRYRALMPGDPDVSALVNAETLAGAIKRAAVLAERNTPVRLTFGPDLPTVVIQAGTAGETAAEENVDVAYFGADTMTVAYNPAYLLSLLAGVTGDAQLNWQAPAKPLVVTSADDTDPYRALICSIKLAGN